MPSLLRNKDDRFEFFAIGGNWGLYHTWQVTPGGAWSGWHGLGGQMSQITAASNLDGRLEVFAIGKGNDLWHIWQTSPGGGWSDWNPLGGSVKQIIVGTNADGRLEVFAIGADKALWHIWQVSPGGSWSSWASLGKNDLVQITVASNKDGRLEVFTRSSSNGLWHIRKDGSTATGWSDWSFISSPFMTLSVVRGLSGELRLYSINGFFGDLEEAFQSPNGGLNPIHPLSDGNKYKVAQAVETSDGIELILIGTDDKFYKRELTKQSGSWSPRSDIDLPAIPDNNVLPPGGIQGFSNLSTLPDASFFTSPIPSTPQERIQTWKEYRAACIGVILSSLFIGAVTGSAGVAGAAVTVAAAAAAATGIGCAIAAQSYIYIEEDKLEQLESPSGSSEPTPSPEERQHGGTDRQPQQTQGVDSSPSSRGEYGNIA